MSEQSKLEQLMQRFTALMDEGKFRDAGEQVAASALTMAPTEPTVLAAVMTAHLKGAAVENLALRLRRQRSVIDTLQEIERTAIPIPDEPPIIYPEAETWRRLTEKRREKWSSVDLATTNPNEKKIITALKTNTELPFTTETPLADVLAYLAERHQIPIQLDRRALDEVGIATDTPVVRELRDITLRSALRLVLRDLNLTYVVKDEVLLVTTPETAASEEFMRTKVYPVADLVVPVQSMGGMGGMGMGMGGGMMGGMGGGMGGGMMGGMGGMGGGMGGMGGGMGGMGGGMGGGFFNLPQSIFPNGVPRNGFRSFSVKDDLNLSAAAPVGVKAAAKARPATVQVAPQAKAIRIEVPAGKSAEEAWSGYFAAHTEVAPEALRQTVRELWSAKKYGEIAALVKAALRNKHAQPWMYEALALALQAGGQPKEEIERAVMSAAEFAETPMDLLCIAVYLESAGLQARALQVYRQAAQIDPLLPDTYLQALRAAKTAGDLEAVQWATVGILSQAWTPEHKDVWQKGYLVAKDTLEKLRAKDAEAAKKYQEALDVAVARDCVLMVTWTGEGDVDLMVEEPAGTACSLRNPRTAAGGVLIGDLRAQVNKENSGARCAVYVCPKGFNGTYRALVRRVWGDVTASRVKVDLCVHFATKEERRMTKSLALEGDQTLVQFDLEGGRRTEPIQEVQVANATARQMSLQQQILAQMAPLPPQILSQQIGSSIDPGSAANLALSRSGNGLLASSLLRGARSATSP